VKQVQNLHDVLTRQIGLSLAASAGSGGFSTYPTAERTGGVLGRFTGFLRFDGVQGEQKSGRERVSILPSMSITTGTSRPGDVVGGGGIVESLQPVPRWPIRRFLPSS
jgi:hypothetical protein